MGKFWVFCGKKCILTYPLQLGVFGRTSVEPITPGPSRRFSEIFRPARFFKLRKRETFDKFKNFADFASFRLINHIKPAKHRRQLTYQDPSFLWLKVLLLGVERWRLNWEFFCVFLRKMFYACFYIPICVCLGRFPKNHCSKAIHSIRKNYHH